MPLPIDNTCMIVTRLLLRPIDGGGGRSIKASIPSSLSVASRERASSASKITDHEILAGNFVQVEFACLCWRETLSVPGGGARRARARAVTEYRSLPITPIPKPKIIVIGTTVWRQEFDRMVVMPVIAVVGLVLAFAFAVLYFKSFSCNSVTDEEVRQKAPRRRHQHHSQHHGNKKRRISTRRRTHSHKDVPIERPVVQQFDQRYYCYFRFSGSSSISIGYEAIHLVPHIHSVILDSLV